MREFPLSNTKKLDKQMKNVSDLFSLFAFQSIAQNWI